MNDAQFLSVAWNQLIQVSLLTVGVWLLTKLFARNRPHLAHAMWLVVLAKCVTPPLLESPTGLFGHVSVPEPVWFEPEEIVVEEAIEPVVPEPRVVVSSPEFESEITVDPLSQGYVLEDDALLGQLMLEDTAFELEDEPVEAVAAISKPPVAEPSVTFLPLWKLWLISAGTVMSLIFLRVMCTLWRVKRHRTETPPELLELVQRLSKQFKLRRRVRVLITSSRVGPAVVGLFRPLLILPDVVTNGRSAKELEPIVAHELLHVRRGDLGIGWLQMLVQSLWWFHPLIWLVNRLLNRETERCCDEAVLAELNCSPGVYARCLLNVLEQKRNLTPIPAFPGVKPVELTKQRMERIMKLGQGCRKRSPWWCWLVVVLLGAVVLPGTAQSQNEDLKPETPSIETRTSNAEPANAEQVLTPRVYDVRELLETLRDEYEFEPNEAERALEQLVGLSLSQLKVAVNPLMPEAKHDPRKCLCSGVSLFAVNTPKGHQQIRKLLELWKERGFYFVTIDSRVATVPVGFFSTNLPSDQRILIEATGSDKQSKTISTLTLKADEFKELKELVQGNANSHLLAFPKITIPQGTQASILDIVERPYILSYKGDIPVIMNIKEGLELHLNPHVLEGTVTQLDCEASFREIVKDEAKPLRHNLGEKQRDPANPGVNTAKVNFSALLEPGQTLLIRGFQKNSGNRAEEIVVLLTATATKLNREFLQPVAGVQEQPTGKLMFGTGVNSDAGVTGSIVLDERNFDLKSPLIYESGKVVEDQKLSLSLPKLSEEQENSYREHLAKLAAQLDQPWKAEYFKRPLSEVLLEFHQTLGVRFVIDRDRIAAAGLSEEVPVNLSLSGVNLRAIFKMVLVNKLAYCTIPVIDTERGSVSSTVLISTRNEIIRLGLFMRSRSIRNFNSIEDLQQSLFDKPSERHRFIEQRLDQPISVEFNNTKLSTACRDIANKAGITVYLDLVSLPKTFSIKTLVKDFQSEDETTLREVLEEICTPLGLIFVVEDEVLKIVDKEWHGEQPVTMVYPLAKLIGTDPRGKDRLQKVITLIKETVEPDSWTEQNGYQILFNERDLSLIIRHKRKTQETIAELLSKVRLETGVNRDRSPNSDAAADVPLDHALQSYATQLKRELLIDEAALGTLEIPIDQRVKVYSLKTHTPEMALKETLRPLGLTYALHDRKVPNQGGAQPMLLVFEQRLLDNHDGPFPYDQLVEMMLERNKQILRHAGERVAKEQARLRRRIPHDIHAPTLQAGLELFEKVADVSIEIEPEVLKAAEDRFLQARTKDQRSTWEIRDREFLSGLRHSLAPLDLIPVVTHRGARHTPQIIIRIVSKDAAESAQASRDENEASAELLSKTRVSVGGGIRLQIPAMRPVPMAFEGVQVHQSEPARPWTKQTWAWLKHTPPWKKFDREISVSFDQIPLKQAIEQICAAGELKFLSLEKDKDPLDQILKTGYPDVMCEESELRELGEETTVLETPVTFSAENKAAIPILEEILEPFGLGLGHMNEVNGKPGGCFDIRTKAFLDRTRWTLIYPVGDLLEKDQSLHAGPTQGVPVLDKTPHQEKLFKAKVLIEALEKALTWDHSEANTANGTMKYRESSEALVIQCDRAQHDVVEKLLRERRKMCGIEITPATPNHYRGPGVMPFYSPNPIAAAQVQRSDTLLSGPGINSDAGVTRSLVLPSGNAHRQLRERLEMKISVDFDREPLHKVVRKIADEAGVNLVLETRDLPEDVFQKSLSSHHEGPIKIRDLLDQICIPLDLIYVVDEEIVKIVGKEWYEQQTIQVVYPFAKLIGNNAQANARVRAISARIKATVEPDSWSKESGYDVFISESTTSLVVRHKRKTHEAIAKLLSQIRLETGVNRDMEVKGRIVSDDSFEPVEAKSSEDFPRSVLPNLLNDGTPPTVQIRFQKPEKARLRIDRDVEGKRINAVYELPVRQNFRAGHRFQMSYHDIPGRVVKSEWPIPTQTNRSYLWTLEVPEWTDQSRMYLSHNSVPVALTNEDLDQIDAGNVVTKVFYLPTKAPQQNANMDVEVMVNTRMDPGLDPIEEAKKRGTIVAVLRSHLYKASTADWKRPSLQHITRGWPSRRLNWGDGSWAKDLTFEKVPSSEEEYEGPLDLVLKYYVKQLNMDCVIEESELIKAGVEISQRVKCRLGKDVDPHTELTKILTPLGLIYTIGELKSGEGNESKLVMVVSANAKGEVRQLKLSEALKRFESAANLKFEYDLAARSEIQQNAELLVYLAREEYSLVAKVRFVLDQVGLVTQIEVITSKSGEKLLKIRVTTKQHQVITKVYPVADLILPIPGTESDPVKDDPILSKLPNQSKLFKAKKKPLSDSAQPLIDLIKKSIEPESWSGEKAVGTIAFHEQNLSIVIRHTEPVHEKVSELLASLRRKQDLQVTLECLTVQFEKNSFTDFWTNVGIVIDHADASAKNSMKPLIFHGVKLDDFRSKIDQFETAKVLSFPKLMVFNGVGAQIQISGAGADKESVPMMHYMIVPTISEDRRTIDVKFAVNAANTLDALTKAKSMTVPDGTSVLIEVTDELLSGQKRTGVPEVDKALRELKKKELGLRTFVLLTARIIIQEEEEVLNIPLIIEEEEEPLLGIPQSKALRPAPDSNTRVGTVTPRIFVQEEEEALLGLPQPAAEPKDRSPAPVPAPVLTNPSP